MKGYLAYFEEKHLQSRQSKWMGWFTTGVRALLVWGFLPAGMVKILGERFTDLHNNQPMGHYLQALFETGYYYTFIGVVQVIAALLLLFPRTVILGVMLYLPIILNICVLSWSVRFEGSLFTAPLMVIACLYLLVWHYDRVRYILPFKASKLPCALPKQQRTNQFPWRFFLMVVAILIGVVAFSVNIFTVMPRNTMEVCQSQFMGTDKVQAGNRFCECVHTQGNPLTECLEVYERAAADK